MITTLPGEDVLVLPESLLAEILPRRGGVPGPPITLDSTAVEIMRRHEREISDVVRKMGGDPTLAEAARAHLRGEVTPLSAAVIATIAAQEAGWNRWDELELFADGWIATRGLTFAAEATAELARVLDHKSPSRTRFNYLRFRTDDDDHWGIGTNENIAERLRAFLAVAEESHYQAVVGALGAYRNSEFQRVIVSFLVPTETEWVEEICREGSATDLHQVHWRLLLSSVGTAAQLDLLRKRERAWKWLSRPELLSTLLSEVGTAALPMLTNVINYPAVREALSALPSDEAFSFLLSKLDQPGIHTAVRDAMGRFPVRALRLLASASTGTSKLATYAARLLRAHVWRNPELVAAVRPNLGPETQAAIDTVDARTKWVAEASPDALPELLVEPPWTRKRKVRKRPVVKNLVPQVVPSDADPAVVGLAKSNPPVHAEKLLPLCTVEIARMMADWLVRLEPVRPTAMAWLHRHGTNAARALVPDALGKPGRQQRAAESALRAIASNLSVAEVVEATRDQGDKAVKAVERLLSTDPLELAPATVPEWAYTRELDLLPQVLLPGRDRALPETATRHLLAMLGMSTKDEVYAGIATVKEHLDPASLAELGWELFEQSNRADWILYALRAIGDDETVRRLTPVIRAWPGENGHTSAVAGLEVLTSIGTEVALMHLHGIATKVKYPGIRTKAQEKVDQIAADLGLGVEELADRLVPDFGLDERGGLVLDYGPRRFTVGFDEQLRPYVADEDGKARKTLPKPAARDDDQLAPAAYQRFTALKKDVRAVADSQIRRFEQAMIGQRRWTTDEFQSLFVAHPLLWHIVRRLLWISDDGRAFRIAEDRTFADIEDNTITLPDTTKVRIAHPVQLIGALQAWSEVFDDYEITQPFGQLGRSVHALTDEEKTATELQRFVDMTVSTFKVIGLERRGWQRAKDKEGGMESWIYRPLPGGRAVVLNLDPGIYVGMLDQFPEQRLKHVWIGADSEDRWFPEPSIPFGELDQVTASEVLADLTDLTS